jgi:hypothetical protein
MQKQTPKRKRRKKAVPVLGAAGLTLSLASGASAAPAANLPAPTFDPSHEIFLAEEEISDVSLATFYVFDKENTGPFRPGLQLVRGGCGGGCGCRGCGGGGCGGFRGCGGGGCGGGGCGGCGGFRGCVGFRGCAGFGFGCAGCVVVSCAGCGGCWGGCCLSWGACRYC